MLFGDAKDTCEGETFPILRVSQHLTLIDLLHEAIKRGLESRL